MQKTAIFERILSPEPIGYYRSVTQRVLKKYFYKSNELSIYNYYMEYWSSFSKRQQKAIIRYFNEVFLTEGAIYLDAISDAIYYFAMNREELKLLCKEIL